MKYTTEHIIILYRWYRCGGCILLCYTPVACSVVTIFTLGAFSAINHACCAAVGLCKNNNNKLNLTELKDTINLPNLKLYIPYFLNEKVTYQKMMLGNAKNVLRNIFKVTTNIIVLPTF